MKLSCFLIVAIGIVLTYSCNQDPEHPEVELKSALDHVVAQSSISGNVILLWKTDALCKQIDCKQKSIFSKKHEYRLADKELHFMYGSPPYLLVKAWHSHPEVEIVKPGK